MDQSTLTEMPPTLPTLLTPWLQQHANLSAAECAHIMELWQQQPETGLPQLLLKLGTVSATDLSHGLAELLQLPRLEPEAYPQQPLYPAQLNPNFLQRHRILPVDEADDLLILAMTDPSNDLAAQSVALACQKSVQRMVADDSTLQSLYESLYGDNPESVENTPDALTPESNSLNVEQLRDMASEAPVIRLVNQILASAVDQQASDIHIEPVSQGLAVRLRRDGILQAIESPPASMAMAVISRIKIMARLDIAERRLPQDGRIDLRIQGSYLDIRVSTVPCVDGESVVMRLLRRDNIISNFSQLGLTDLQQSRVQQLLAQPHGLIVVSGPTGSGKTTSLYTALQYLNQPERKIITVEDPVEYQLAGINQIQVNNDIGLSFASALRTIVRQDPDIIMVGEMRDQEAAEICVQSALTGHLVLSTLHTNQAAGCITRLLEMGIPGYLLNSTLLAAIGQRLVRRLCQHCTHPAPATAEQQQTLGVQTKTPLMLNQPVGCEHCNHTGYRGRIALIELLPMTSAIQQQIQQQADEHQLHQSALADGMTSMFQEGCIRVLAGETTLDEVLRVAREV